MGTVVLSRRGKGPRKVALKAAWAGQARGHPWGDRGIIGYSCHSHGPASLNPVLVWGLGTMGSRTGYWAERGLVKKWPEDQGRALFGEESGLIVELGWVFREVRSRDRERKTKSDQELGKRSTWSGGPWFPAILDHSCLPFGPGPPPTSALACVGSACSWG